MITGRHSCKDEWAVTDKDQFIQLEDLRHIFYNREPQLVYHDQIAWHGMKDPSSKADHRYQDADIMVPGILAEGVPNPHDKKYRMVDGSHRMAKMKLETRYEASFFYIISKDEFYEVLRFYDEDN